MMCVCTHIIALLSYPLPPFQRAHIHIISLGLDIGPNSLNSIHVHAPASSVSQLC